LVVSKAFATGNQTFRSLNGPSCLSSLEVHTLLIMFIAVVNP